MKIRLEIAAYAVAIKNISKAARDDDVDRRFVQRCVAKAPKWRAPKELFSCAVGAQDFLAAPKIFLRI